MEISKLLNEPPPTPTMEGSTTTPSSAHPVLIPTPSQEPPTQNLSRQQHTVQLLTGDMGEYNPSTLGQSNNVNHKHPLDSMGAQRVADRKRGENTRQDGTPPSATHPHIPTTSNGHSQQMIIYPQREMNRSTDQTNSNITIFYPNSSRVLYHGGYLNGWVHGEGSSYYSNGFHQYVGRWRRGKRHGQGVEFSPFTRLAISYKGQWIDDERHGWGIQYHSIR